MSKKDELETRSKNAILQNAIMRWENILVLAGSAVASVAVSTLGILEGPRALIPFGVGTALYGALVWSSLTDDKGNAEIVADVLQQEYQQKVDALHSLRLRGQVNEALEYRKKINLRLENERSRDGVTGNLANISAQFEVWVEEIYTLAERIDRYLQKRGEQERAYKKASERYKHLSKRKNNYSNKQVQGDLQTNLDGLQRQLDTIKELEDTMKRAQLKLENTLVTMGTMYTQAELIDAKEIDGSRYRRLQQEIDDEVHGLSDVLDAMNEIHNETS